MTVDVEGTPEETSPVAVEETPVVNGPEAPLVNGDATVEEVQATENGEVRHERGISIACVMQGACCGSCRREWCGHERGCAHADVMLFAIRLTLRSWGGEGKIESCMTRSGVRCLVRYREGCGRLIHSTGRGCVMLTWSSVLLLQVEEVTEALKQLSTSPQPEAGSGSASPGPSGGQGSSGSASHKKGEPGSGNVM